MVDPTPSDYNLTYLRERWERDRSSRIFLQLAEEYRRRGLHAEALEVLETGLGFHPGYLAAQVALGRCRLEAGQPETAVKVLERVLTQDPTQAVATRLLAESWLQLGDEDRTQAVIDRCRLIGIPPSELTGLEQRLAAARRATRERWQDEPEEPVVPAASAAPVDVPAADEAEAPWAAVPELQPQETPQPVAAVAESTAASEPPAPPPSESDRPELAPTPTAPPSQPPAYAAELAPGPGHVFSLPPRAARGVVLPLRPGAERKVVGARGNPFGVVGRPRPRPPESAEIFRLVPPPPPEPKETAQPAAEAPAPAPSAPPPSPARTSPPAVAIPTTAPPAAAASPAPSPAADRWWAKPAETPAAIASPLVSAPTPTPRPVTPAAPAPPATPTTAPAAPAARWWERPTEVAPPAPATPSPAAAAPSAPVAPPPPAGVAPPPPAGVAPPPAASSPLAASPGVELQPSGTLVHPELRPSDPGTATLGELYLRQGYVREAEEIFKQVLARDAENEAALAGLEAIGRKRAQKLTAAELIAGDEEGEGEVRGLTARKIQLLSRYLGKLRRGA